MSRSRYGGSTVRVHNILVSQRVYHLWIKAVSAGVSSGAFASRAEWCRRSAEADYRETEFPGEIPNPGPHVIWPSWTLHPNAKTMFRFRARINEVTFSAWVRGALTRQAMAQLGASEEDQRVFLDSLRVDARE
jgi:hypothetical protein